MSATIIEFPIERTLATLEPAGALLGVNITPHLGRYLEPGFECMPLVSTVFLNERPWTRVQLAGYPTRHYPGELLSEDAAKRYADDELEHLKKQ